MYGWHPTVYKIWAYFILANMYPLIVVERLMVWLYSFVCSKKWYWNNQLENLQFLCPNCHSLKK